MMDWLKILLPAASAIIAWVMNERSKAHATQLQRKEERYQELLRCLRGFYVSTQDTDLKKKFIEQTARCWLYAPDDVIRRANDFLTMISTDRQPGAAEDEKNRALAEYILAIRSDMLGRRLVTQTALTSSDWKNFHA